MSDDLNINGVEGQGSDTQSDTIDVTAGKAPTADGVVAENNIETTNAADQKETIRYLPFDVIKADHSRNPRFASKYAADGPAGDKARSIHKHGLLNPLLVSERADGSYWLLQGHLRHGGILLIRTTGLPAKGKEWPAIDRDANFMNKVKCRVMKGLSLADEMDLIMDHGTTTPLDKREMYVAARNMYRMGFTETLIAEKLGFKSRGPASLLIRLARMPQVVEDMYLADPKADSYVPVTDQMVNDLYKAYNTDQKAPNAKVKEGGKEFNALFEKITSTGKAERKKALPSGDLISLAEVETDGDLRDLLEAIANASKEEAAQALERLRMRLTPINQLGPVTIVEEGIAHTAKS